MSKKFFNELYNNSHLDVRYGKQNIPMQYLNIEFKYLLKMLVTLCNEKDIKLIVMHGSLIGWYFNKKMLPWDDDIDLCIVGDSIEKFNDLNGYDHEKFIIEVNPNSINRNPNDKNNVIDARIISKKSGIFIDITFLKNTPNFPAFINCKSPHYYKINDILPLREDQFEDCKICIPNNYGNCLLQEYGNRVFNHTYRGWKFIK